MLAVGPSARSATVTAWKPRTPSGLRRKGRSHIEYLVELHRLLQDQRHAAGKRRVTSKVFGLRFDPSNVRQPHGSDDFQEKAGKGRRGSRRTISWSGLAAGDDDPGETRRRVPISRRGPAGWPLRHDGQGNPPRASAGGAAPIAIAGQWQPLVPCLQQLHEPRQPAGGLIVEGDAETTGVHEQAPFARRASRRHYPCRLGPKSLTRPGPPDRTAFA